MDTTSGVRTLPLPAPGGILIELTLEPSAPGGLGCARLFVCGQPEEVRDVLSMLILIVAAAGDPGSTGELPAADNRAATVIVSGIDRPFDWREPLRPEPWWPVGGAVLRYFDRTTVVARGEDLADLIRNIDRALDDAGLNTIGRIEFWTHGGTGYFRIQGRRHYADVFLDPPARVRAALERLRDRLAVGAVVHFRSCSTFHGREGKRFAAAAQRFFNQTNKRITVMGHSRPTGLTHPGWQTLAPDDGPRWPTVDGQTEVRLEGAQILARDLLRFFSGGLYDAAIAVREHTLPRLLGSLGTGIRAHAPVGYNSPSANRPGP